LLKTLGYLVSAISVLRLGAASAQATIDNPPLVWSLVAGVASSMLGMFLRWLSYMNERRQKLEASARSTSANR
jgi:hypothetical protein